MSKEVWEKATAAFVENGYSADEAMKLATIFMSAFPNVDIDDLRRLDSGDFTLCDGYCREDRD
jgi:hypothetical protein